MRPAGHSKRRRFRWQIDSFMLPAMNTILRVFGAFVLLCLVALAALKWGTAPLDWRQSFAGEACCVDITHAGGLLDGAAYTNSLEALDQNFRSGRRIFEVDLALTADGAIVLAHDWEAYGGAAPDRTAFLAGGGLTRLDFKAFVAWIAGTCADCRIVTDVKFDFWRFWEAYRATVPAAMQEAQFVLQTYDFATAHALAARAPRQPQILTLYLLESVTTEDFTALAPLDSLLAVTMPLNRVPFLAGAARATAGKPVFAHGYPWTMRSDLILRLARAFGVTGFYKD